METKYIKYKSKTPNTNNDITKIKFPYYNLFYDFSISKFKKLVKDNNPKIINHIPDNIVNRNEITRFNDKYLFIELNWNSSEELDSITDYFTEKCRIQCHTSDKITPLDYWKKNKDQLINKTTNLKELRSIVYKNSGYCSGFRISVALTVLKIFKAKKWLDISAGWGDRLISAIGYDVDLYCGVDPNECLHSNYQKIIKTLVPLKDQDKYILIKDGFETAKLPNEKFDLVFSSPPFFDVEVYSTNKEDSITQYKKGDDWYNKFLLPSIRKANDYLTDNGHLVLYIGEGKTYKYLDKMLNDVNKFMNYKGKFFYYYDDTHYLKRFFVWANKLNGTGFQRLVREAIQKIPYGETRTYSEIAENINDSHAYRAVANACGLINWHC